MDVATPVETARPATWNPLRCGGTALLPNVLLMAKLIALCLLLTQHVRLLPEPFLPLVPLFDQLGHPKPFQWVLRLVFVGSALALLLNHWVRISASLLGLSILVGVLSSKVYYGNDKVFCGLILLLAGLQQRGQEPWLLRYQVAIVYFGAGLNKLLDADWRSGQFFEHWAFHRLKHDFYMSAASWLPPKTLSQFIGWATIATELGLSVGFLVRRFYPYAIWGGILFHTAMLLFTDSTFTMFFYAMLASFLVFVEWPRSPMLVLYDGDCGFCASVKSWFERFDPDAVYRWEPYQTGAGARFGIREEALRDRLHVVLGSMIYTGFAAFKVMAFYNPVTFFGMALLVAVPGPGPSLFRNVVVVVLVLLFSPLFAPVGEAVYDLVAGNRHRIPSKQRCQIS